MKRRALLAALVPLVSGCFSGTDPESSASSETPTPPETATPTPEPTPTETATPTPAGSRMEAADRIETAQDRLLEAVYLFSGGVSNDLLDVSAESTGFEARETLLKLYAVQTAVDEAEDVAATDRQRRTISALHGMRRFMTQATDLQASLIDSHEAVADVYEALEEEKSDATVEDRLETLDDAVTNTDPPLAVITEEIDPATAEVTDAIDVAEFEAKRTQFVHERDVLTTLFETLDEIYSSRTELDGARTKADDGEYTSAADAADRVAESLEESVERLETLESDPPSRADAFEDLVGDTLDLARDYAGRAEDLHDRYD